MAYKKRGNVETIVLQIVSDKTNRELAESVTLDSRLKDDLNLDSLTMMEIIVAIEGALKIRIDERMSGVETVRDMVAHIESDGKSEPDTEYNIEDYPLTKAKKHLRWLKLFMWLSRLAWRFKVAGQDNLPVGGRYILCPNHQSHLDGLWIWAAIGRKHIELERVCCLAKQEHVGNRISRFGLSILGGIPVDRSGNTLPAMKRGLTCLQDGYTMLIHPEGTRTRDGNMQEFKGGAAKLAIDADVLIVPVRIEGAWDIFPAHKKLPKVFRFGRRYPIKISFGKPIAPDGKSVEKLTALVQSAVEQLGECDEHRY